MSTPPQAPTARATLDDLARTRGKAELIGGRVVPLIPAGVGPGLVAARIFRSLDDHAEAAGRGVAFTGSIAYAFDELSSGRESFSPDASYHLGPLPVNGMDFIGGPPTFAVEVRSEGDYGPSAEIEMAAKRADYFEAGTLVVWDVDPIAEVVRIYRPGSPDVVPAIGRGDVADAEPAVPGWRMPVDRIFPRPDA